MQDDHLLYTFDAETADRFRAAGVTTFTQLYALLRDENADVDLRERACQAVYDLQRVVDKRRAVPALVVALQSTDDKLRQAAAHALGGLKSRRGVKPLIQFVSNKNLPRWVRVETIIALCFIDDQQSSQFLRKVMFDQNEHLQVRSEVIEWMQSRDLKRALMDWITLLSDPASDIRFWAAYRLSQHFYNIIPALTQLDRVVAFDHTLPAYWGWHIDREAIAALEIIYMSKLLGITEGAEGFYSRRIYIPWLISPAPEYMTFVAQYRKWAEDWTYYTTTPLLPITLDIDPIWLADRLREQWPDAQLNTREPRPQAYLLDWRVTMDGKMVSGALHRDRDAVVLTGDDVYPFAAWYRSIIAPEQPLFLYEWADFGVELRPGMTASDIEAAKRTEDDRHTMKV